MADYGVPTDLEGALPWGWAAERLARCRNFWVTTVDPRHRPHSMPVWGVWSESDQRFFFSCASSSLKARNLAENPNVVVAIDDTVEVVSVEGVATPLAVGADADRYIAAYVAKYEPDPVKAAAMTEFVAENSMFSVTPHRAFAVIEREEDFGPKATRWVWGAGTHVRRL
jgi:Pyridoxamine 5'-phosphate oxidase